MDTLLAGLPIIVVVALLALRVRAAVAVLAGIAVAVASAGAFPVAPELAVATAGSMGWVALTVAVIMFSGIALTNLQRISGAQQALSVWLNQWASSPERAVLGYGIALVPLVESLVGWGMGVIVVLPLLVGTGIPKLRAIRISLLGLVLCPWGSFSPALLLLAQVTGLDLAEIGTATAWCNAVVIAVLGVAIVLVSGGRAQLAGMRVELPTVWIAMSAVLIAVNAFLAPPLGGVLSALAGALVLSLFARAERARRAREERARTGRPREVPGPAGSQAVPPITMPLIARRGLVPYAVVLLGIGGATVVAPLVAAGPLRDLLANPACWLALALGCAPLALGLTASDTARGLVASLRAFAPAVLVTLLFIGFGVLIGVNGMGAKLAEAATGLGGAFALLVPLAGFVSGFVTSSNTASAAMLGEPLRAAAAGIGADPVALLGAHTAAVGAGIMTNPSRAVLAIEAARLLPGDGSDDPEAGISLGSVLAPALWANAVIVAVLTAIVALLPVAGS